MQRLYSQLKLSKLQEARNLKQHARTRSLDFAIRASEATGAIALITIDAVDASPSRLAGGAGAFVDIYVAVRSGPPGVARAYRYAVRVVLNIDEIY